MINVLSVDWDYYFPDAVDWDWSHDEENPIYYDFVWQTRAGSGNLRTGKRACDAYRPDKSLLKGFWERLIKEPPLMLAIAESHKDAYRYLEHLGVRGARLVNFDAHHDCWWNNMCKPKQVNCGNWVYHALKDGIISRYDLRYPPFASENYTDVIDWPEGEDHDDKVHVYFHDMKKRLPRRFHYVFICRSSCWTPPWADRDFLKFVGFWRRYPSVWDEKMSVPYAMKPRALTLTQARKMASEWRKMMLLHQNDLKTKAV